MYCTITSTVSRLLRTSTSTYVQVLYKYKYSSIFVELTDHTSGQQFLGRPMASFLSLFASPTSTQTRPRTVHLCHRCHLVQKNTRSTASHHGRPKAAQTQQRQEVSSQVGIPSSTHGVSSSCESYSSEGVDDDASADR
jgi:hypothetical protein